MNNPQQNIAREDDNDEDADARSNFNLILPRPHMASSMNHTSKSIDEQFRVIQERIFASTPVARPMAIDPGRIRMAQMLNARDREDQRSGSSGLNRFLSAWSRNAAASASASEAKTENETEAETETGNSLEQSQQQQDQSSQGDETTKSNSGKSSEDETCTGSTESSKDAGVDNSINDRKRKSDDTGNDQLDHGEACGNRKPNMFERIRTREWTKEEIDRINDFAQRWNPSNGNKKRRKKRRNMFSSLSAQVDRKKDVDDFADSTTRERGTGPENEDKRKSEDKTGEEGNS